MKKKKYQGLDTVKELVIEPLVRNSPLNLGPFHGFFLGLLASFYTFWGKNLTLSSCVSPLLSHYTIALTTLLTPHVWGFPPKPSNSVAPSGCPII